MLGAKYQRPLDDAKDVGVCRCVHVADGYQSPQPTEGLDGNLRHIRWSREGKYHFDQWPLCDRDAAET